jgi:hypothetical protein
MAGIGLENAGFSSCEFRGGTFVRPSSGGMFDETSKAGQDKVMRISWFYMLFLRQHDLISKFHSYRILQMFIHAWAHEETYSLPRQDTCFMSCYFANFENSFDPPVITISLSPFPNTHGLMRSTHLAQGHRRPSPAAAACPCR